MNLHRGEIAAQLNGKPVKLRLTLGALAELETNLDNESLLDFARRLGEGQLRAKDILLILGAALRGGGHSVHDDEVAALMPPDGLEGAARLAANVMAAAFRGAETVTVGKPPHPPNLTTTPSPGKD